MENSYASGWLRNFTCSGTRVYLGLRVKVERVWANTVKANNLKIASKAPLQSRGKEANSANFCIPVLTVCFQGHHDPAVSAEGK